MGTSQTLGRTEPVTMIPNTPYGVSTKDGKIILAGPGIVIKTYEAGANDTYVPRLKDIADLMNIAYRSGRRDERNTHVHKPA